MSTFDSLAAKIPEVDAAFREAIGKSVLEDMPEAYREKLEQALRDMTYFSASAMTGDATAAGELSIVKARIMLWTWAGVEHARQAMLAALKLWIYEAAAVLGELAVDAVALGLKALIESGLEDL